MDLTSEQSVNREIVMRDAHVAAQGAVCRKNALQTTGINSSSAQLAVGLDAWTFVSTLKVAVGIPDGQNVERTTRRNFHNRRPRKTSQQRSGSTRALPF